MKKPEVFVQVDTRKVARSIDLARQAAARLSESLGEVRTTRSLLLETYGTAEQRKAQFDEHPCELVAYHAPRPVMTEHHHSKPVFLQNRLYGKILYPADLWVCSNCHDAIHAWLYWLLGERKQPTYMGRAAKAEAERTYAWYLEEQERLASRGLEA